MGRKSLVTFIVLVAAGTASAQTVHDRGMQLAWLMDNWLFQSYFGYNPGAAQAMAAAQSQQQIARREATKSTVERQLRREVGKRPQSKVHADGFGYTTECGETQLAWRLKPR